MHTLPSEIFAEHVLEFHLYSGDKQIYAAFRASLYSSHKSCILNINDSVSDIGNCITANILEIMTKNRSVTCGYKTTAY